MTGRTNLTKKKKSRKVEPRGREKIVEFFDEQERTGGNVNVSGYEYEPGVDITPLSGIPDTELSPEDRAAVEHEVEAALHLLYPHGHPDFMPNTLAELQLHSEKNHDYAAGGDPLGNFDRVAAILQMYPGFPYNEPEGVALIYALKQVDAVMWGLAKNIDHKVEGFTSRLQDISVYSKLTNIIINARLKREPR